MEKKPLILTAEGLQKMTDELNYLKNVKRVEVKENLATARSFGDLSENSEYDEAKDEQAKVETRINELEEALKNVVVISEDDLKNDVVNLGMSVTVYDPEFDEEIVYHVVGTNEVDADTNHISDQSPIGSALLGCSTGDEVTVEAPGGSYKLIIREIKKKA
ncbi:MAG: transcription elongation factor GreA [Clostridia bacterium]|nr:transcription elongation factor GreA [Clostridia bacterium]